MQLGCKRKVNRNRASHTHEKLLYLPNRNRNEGIPCTLALTIGIEGEYSLKKY